MREYLKLIAKSLPKEVYHNRYEQNALKLYQYTDNVFYTKIAERIVKNLDDNYLEIGCGTGVVANKVAEHIDTVIGVDKSFNMVKKTKINKASL